MKSILSQLDGLWSKDDQNPSCMQTRPIKPLVYTRYHKNISKKCTDIYKVSHNPNKSKIFVQKICHSTQLIQIRSYKRLCPLELSHSLGPRCQNPSNWSSGCNILVLLGHHNLFNKKYISWYALCQTVQVFLWRIHWISWAHSRWRLQRRSKGSKNKHWETAARTRHIDQLADATESAWREQAVIKLLKKHSIGKSSDMAGSIVFSSTKTSMDQLPTDHADHHPLLQVRIPSEHSGVIGSTKSATAWHICHRNRQSCYAVNKSKSKCHTQPLPSIEKSALHMMAKKTYIRSEQEISGLNQKRHDAGMFLHFLSPVVFNVTFTVMLMRHRPSGALVLWNVKSFSCRFVTLIPSIRQNTEDPLYNILLYVLLYTLGLRIDIRTTYRTYDIWLCHINSQQCAVITHREEFAKAQATMVPLE